MIARNKYGRRYVVGIGDAAKWAEVRDAKEEEPNATRDEIARKCKVSISTVTKVLARKQLGEDCPRPPRHYDHHHELNEVVHKPIIDDLLSQRGGVTTIRQLTQQFNEQVGDRYSKSAIADFLSRCGISRKNGNLVDPRKFLPANEAYYAAFLAWRSELTFEQRMKLVFFDEVRIEKADLGPHHVYVQRGQVGNVWSYHGKSGVTESFTFTIMTTLMNEFPLVYTFIPGPSNGKHFRRFVIECLPYIPQGAIVLGDNCSFHVQGNSAEFASVCFRQAGAAFYGAIPKYSPELNPEEKVNSKLKSLLRKCNINAPLLTSAFECLRQVSWSDVHNYYCNAGYL